jgi:hypothetical protein
MSRRAHEPQTRTAWGERPLAQLGQFLRTRRTCEEEDGRRLEWGVRWQEPEVSSSLDNLVIDFARAIRAVDAVVPPAPRPGGAGKTYQPGIGPYTELRVIKLVMEYLAETDPARYRSYRRGVPYADGTGQICDLCLGEPPAWDCAIEIKMLRFLGDKEGVTNDGMITHILSPYPANRSALTDCTKLLASKLGRHKAIIVYGYDYPDWPMDPAIAAFEFLAARNVHLTNRTVAAFDGLVHPIHQRGRVFGWEVQSRD